MVRKSMWLLGILVLTVSRVVMCMEIQSEAVKRFLTFEDKQKILASVSIPTTKNNPHVGGSPYIMTESPSVLFVPSKIASDPQNPTKIYCLGKGSEWGGNTESQKFIGEFEVRYDDGKVTDFVLLDQYEREDDDTSNDELKEDRSFIVVDPNPSRPNRFAVGVSGSDMVEIYDWDKIQQFSLPYKKVLHMAFGRDGAIAVACADNVVSIFDFDYNEIVDARFEVEKDAVEEITQLVFDPTNNVNLAVAGVKYSEELEGYEGKVQIWNTQTVERIRQLLCEGEIFKLAFNPSRSSQLVAQVNRVVPIDGINNVFVNIWDIEKDSQEPLYTFETKHLGDFSFSEQKENVLFRTFLYLKENEADEWKLYCTQKQFDLNRLNGVIDLLDGELTKHQIEVLKVLAHDPDSLTKEQKAELYEWGFLLSELEPSWQEINFQWFFDCLRSLSSKLID